MVDSLARARTLWRIAIAVAALSFVAGLAWAHSDPGLDWVWGVIAFGLAAILYNLVYFGLCAAFAPGLADRIVEEDVTVEGDDVVTTTIVDPGDDPAAAFYIRAYGAARAASMAILGTVGAAAIILLVFG